MDNLAVGVQELQGVVVIFQAGGQGQLHVRAPADCNTNDMTTTSPACTQKHALMSATTKITKALSLTLQNPFKLITHKDGNNLSACF